MGGKKNDFDKKKRERMPQEKFTRLEKAIRSCVWLVMLHKLDVSMQLQLYNTFHVCFHICFELLSKFKANRLFEKGTVHDNSSSNVGKKRMISLKKRKNTSGLDHTT